MTLAHYPWVVPLAAADSFQHMGQRFRRHAFTWQLGQIGLFVALVALAGVSAWLLSRYLRRRDGMGYDSSRGLFVELCRAHGLDWSSRRLLTQWARSLQLPSPALLFVDPFHFQTDPQDSRLRQRRDELQSLRDRIYGGDWCEANLGTGQPDETTKEAS